MSGPLRDPVDVFRPTTIRFLSCLLAGACLLASCSLGNSNHYINSKLGYEITGPSGWVMIPSKEQTTVQFRKYKGNRDDNAIIRVDVELGNPYGPSLLDFAEQGIYKQMKYYFETEEQVTVEPRLAPFTVERNGRPWGTVSFYADYHKLFVYFVTMEDDFVFIVSLETSGQLKSRDEQVFLKALDSLVIYKRDRKNVFLQK